MSEDKNPQDLTVRDRRAYNKKFEEQESRIRRLEIDRADLNILLINIKNKIEKYMSNNL